MRANPILYALLVLLQTSCQPNSTAADIEKLNSLQQQVDSAIMAGDTERYVALLTEDAVLMPPNGPEVVGRQAIRSWNDAMTKQVRVVSYAPVDAEVVVAGDWAFRRATAAWTIAPVAGGNSIREVAKFVIIYRRQPDGSWRVARDIWNGSTQPR